MSARMTVDELRPLLAAYRIQVEQGWSNATAHPDYAGADGSPRGQCGVTSAWLQERLWEDHAVLTTYVVGDVIPRVGQPLRDHCWLEAGRGVDRVVIDLTVDQAFPGAEMCGGHWDLLLESRHYLAHHHQNRWSVAADPVQARLAVLQEALA